MVHICFKCDHMFTGDTSLELVHSPQYATVGRTLSVLYDHTIIITTVMNLHNSKCDCEDNNDDDGSHHYCYPN